MTNTVANEITPIPTDVFTSYQSSNSILWKDFLPRLHTNPTVSGLAALSSAIPLCDDSSSDSSSTSISLTYPCRHDPIGKDCGKLTEDENEACGVVFALVSYDSYEGQIAREQMACFQFDTITLIFLNDDESIVHSLESGDSSDGSSGGSSGKVVTILGRYPSLLLGGGEDSNDHQWMPVDIPDFDLEAYAAMASDGGASHDSCKCSSFPPQKNVEKIYRSKAASDKSNSPQSVALSIFDAIIIPEDVVMRYLKRYSMDTTQRKRLSYLPSVRVDIAREAACSWVRHEYSRGAYVSDQGVAPLAEFTKWIPAAVESVKKRDGRIPLRFEYPGWLSGSLANAIAKVLVERVFQVKSSKAGTIGSKYNVEMIPTTSSQRTVGRIAHASDIPKEQHLDFVSEVWGTSSTKIQDKFIWAEYIDVISLGYNGAEGYFYAGRGLGDSFPTAAAAAAAAATVTKGEGEGEGDSEEGCSATKKSTGVKHFKSLVPDNAEASSFYKLLGKHVDPNLSGTYPNGDPCPSPCSHLLKKYKWIQSPGYYLTRECQKRMTLFEKGELSYKENGPPCVPFLHPNPGWYSGEIEATMNNLNIPLNITYSQTTSASALLKIVEERHALGFATFFYWWEPDPFFAILAGKGIPFNKIKFPVYNAVSKNLHDATPDSNMVCDFPISALEVIIRKEMKNFAKDAYDLLSLMRLKKNDIEYAMGEHLVLSKSMLPVTLSENIAVTMAAATKWVDAHPKKWRPWVSGCLDPMAKNYNKFALGTGKEFEGSYCDCEDWIHAEIELRSGPEVCQVPNEVPMPLNFQAMVTLREDSGGFDRALQCRKNSTMCVCPLPLEREDELLTLFWDFPETAQNPDSFHINVMDISDETIRSTFIVNGSQRHLIVNLTKLDNRKSWRTTSYGPKIYSLEKTADILSVKRVGKRRVETSKQPLRLPAPPNSVPWHTVIECAQRGQFLNDVDCRPAEWQCEPCPVGAACGGGADYQGGMCTFDWPWEKESTLPCQTEPRTFDVNDINDVVGTKQTGVPLVDEESACRACNFTGLFSRANLLDASSGSATSGSATSGIGGFVEEGVKTSQGRWFGGEERHLWTRSRPGFWRDMEAWRLSMAVGQVQKLQQECENSEGQTWIQLKDLVSEMVLSQVSPTSLKKGSFHPERYICSDSNAVRQSRPLDAFRACLTQSACPGGPGGDVCLQNSTVGSSRMCEQCSAGYIKIARICTNCDAMGPGSMVVVILILTFFFFGLVAKVALVQHRKKQKKNKNKNQDEIIHQSSNNPALLDENVLYEQSQHCTPEETKARQEARRETDINTYHKFHQPLKVKLKIIIAYAQIITVFGQLLPIRYLLQQESLNDSIGTIASFDLSSISWLSCQFNWDYLDHLLFNTLCPEIVGMLLPALMYLITWIVLTRKKTKTSIQMLKKLKALLVNFAVTFLLIVYPTASKKIVRFFDCDSNFDDQRSYLRADYSLECYGDVGWSSTATRDATRSWDGMYTYAIVSVMIIPIGIPLMLSFLLYFTHRNSNLYNYVIKKGHTGKQIRMIGEFPVPAKQSAQQFGSLFIGYEEDSYLFEVWDMLRRLFLTSGWTLIAADHPVLQMCSLLIFIVFCILVQAWQGPYISSSADFLALILQFAMFTTVFTGVCMVVAAGGNSIEAFDNSSATELWSSLCFASVVAGYSYCFFSMIYELYYGKMKSEWNLYNNGRCPEEQKSWTEWTPYYKEMIRARLAKKLDKFHLHHSSSSSSSSSSSQNENSSSSSSSKNDVETLNGNKSPNKSRSKVLPICPVVSDPREEEGTVTRSWSET